MSTPLHAPLEQWVHSVCAFSSEYSSSGWCANRIIGASNVYPRYGDFSNSWTPRSYSTHEYIEFEYDRAVLPTALHVYETCTPGAIVKISMRKDSNSSWIVAWQGARDEDAAKSNVSRVWKVDLIGKLIPEPMKQVRFDLDMTKNPQTGFSWPYYYELDAVQLVGNLSEYQIVCDLNVEMTSLRQQLDEQKCENERLQKERDQMRTFVHQELETIVEEYWSGPRPFDTSNGTRVGLSEDALRSVLNLLVQQSLRDALWQKDDPLTQRTLVWLTKWLGEMNESQMEALLRLATGTTSVPEDISQYAIHLLPCESGVQRVLKLRKVFVGTQNETEEGFVEMMREALSRI